MVIAIAGAFGATDPTTTTTPIRSVTASSSGRALALASTEDTATGITTDTTTVAAITTVIVDGYSGFQGPVPLA
jgi:hypothetical protein